MKILFVNNLFGTGSRGGAEHVVRLEAETLAAAGNEVVVVHAARQRTEVGTNPRAIGYPPGNLFYYADAATHSYAARLAFHAVDAMNPRSASEFGRILRRERPDVVHTHNLLGLGFSLPGAIRRCGIHHVHTVHDVQLLHPSGLIPGTDDPRAVRLGFAASLRAGMLRMQMGSPNAALFPSPFMRALHDRYGFFPKSRKRTLPNPSMRATPAQAPAVPRFLFVGQLEPHKGILDLLDAWKNHGISGATLEIVGNGTLAREVRWRVGTMPGVTVSGRLEGSALADAYRRASFVVMPSRVIENDPTALADASAFGVPMISSRTGGVPETVREGETGFLHAPGDVAGLREAIRRAASSPERGKLSANAVADAEKRRNIAAHVDALLEEYSR